MDRLPDALLVHSTLTGNQAAFGELVHRYQDRLYTTIAMRVRNPEDAQDLLQEVFIKAYAGLAEFRGNASFSTWLHRIALNLCIDFLRLRRRTPELLSLADLAPAEAGAALVDLHPGSDPERTVVARECLRLLHQAITALPEPYRAAVRLRELEGLEFERIAAILRCPIGTAKSRSHRGRCLLREELAPLVEGIH